MFVKEKFSAAGEFLKTKARLVAGGDGQDRALYDNISSPTVSLEAVMAILAIAAIQSRKLALVDITGAYLECVMPEGDEVLMELDALLTSILRELDPSVIPFINEHGKVIVKLNRALYGCVQSARLWFEKLRDTLIDIGFIANPYDPCTFNMMKDGVQITVAFHVDDLLITSTSEDNINFTINQLKSKFSAVSETRGDVLSYLGMQIKVNSDFIEVNMSGYIDKILQDRDSQKVSSTPAGPNLLEHDDSVQLLNGAEQKLFHADVAKALFLAKRVMYQIMPAISVLAGRVTKATKEDQNKLDKVYAYIRASRDLSLKFKRGGIIDLKCFADASWAVHMDRHGRTGIVVMLANCCVGAWSYKQKMITLSSTEAEIVALSDAAKIIMWFRLWLTAQGILLGATPIFQDNESVLKLMMNERRANQRTRHLDVRLFYPQDLVLAKEITLKWIATLDMIADLMTKPVQGASFTRLTNLLTGNSV
jgi:hypothetical protein